MIWKKTLLITIIILLGSLTWSQSKRELTRIERELPPPPLVYPFGATLKLLLGCTVPISMPGRILVYGQNFQFQFPLPQNATLFSDYFKPKVNLLRRRRRRRQSDDKLPAERSVFYQVLEEELRRRGGPGRDCLKRSICEYAETPFGDDGLVGEIFHVLLTPDYGGNSDVDKDYIEAAEIGRTGGDCSRAYSSCPDGFGFLDHITRVFHLQ